MAGASPDTESFLEFQDVSRTFSGSGASFSLESISFGVPRGATAMIAGPSGSGKTTLLNLAAGLDRPDEGAIRYGGACISAMPEAARAKWRGEASGYVFQHHYLPAGMRCGEAVAAPLLWTRKCSPKDALARASEALEAAGLAGFEKRGVDRLSGGQRQRVAIARALASEPQLVLADEPTAQLDRETAAGIVGLLKDYVRRTAAIMLVVSHENQAGDWNASMTLSLRDGKLVA